MAITMRLVHVLDHLINTRPRKITDLKTLDLFLLNIFSLHHLHTLMELVNILKKRKPISLAQLFKLSHRSSYQILRIPKHNLVQIENVTLYTMAPTFGTELSKSKDL